MATLALAADPVLPWDTLSSSLGQLRLRSQEGNRVVFDGVVSGLPATVEYLGSGFGADGAGLLAGTATLTTYRHTVGGQVVYLLDGATLTGAPLRAWLGGDATASAQAVLAGNDLILLSNMADSQIGYGGDDYMDGLGGNDTLLGAAGDDTLVGGAGDNRLEGGDGDDLLMAGTGRDWAHGGAGTDTFIASHTLRNQAQVAVSAPKVTVAGPYPQAMDTLVSVERIAFLDGVLHLDPAGSAGQVRRLYASALGRDAETTGSSAWVDALEAGALTIDDVARSFLSSAEFAQRYGQLDDAGFVMRLYANVLGRDPDAAGLDGWTAQVTKGVSRAEVLLGFSESAEHRAATDAGMANGLWTVDAEALEVLRCYMTVLGRQPDAFGLSNWTLQRNNDLLTATEMTEAFIDSLEFRARYGAPSDKELVERLYLNALDRAADETGLAHWTEKLDDGALSRRDVVQGFAYSEEMTQKLLPLVGDGIAFA